MLEGQSITPNAVALSANGKRAVADDWDLIRVWGLEGKRPPQVLKGHKESVRAVAITADGRYAISGSFDNTLWVWDLENSQCLAVFSCDAGILFCGWGGNRIVAGDESGHIHHFIWEE